MKLLTKTIIFYFRILAMAFSNTTRIEKTN